jgi:hypothetical protein
LIISIDLDRIVLGYERHDFQFTGNYADKGFIEEYTCLIQGAPPALSSQLPATPPGRPSTSW